MSGLHWAASRLFHNSGACCGDALWPRARWQLQADGEMDEDEEDNVFSSAYRTKQTQIFSQICSLPDHTYKVHP